MTIEEEARKIVQGERQSAYGSPEDSFSAIAGLWNGYFAARRGCHDLSAEDVANMMILLKVARNMRSCKRDNVVDVIGYAMCLARLQGIEQEAVPHGGQA